MTRPRQLLPLVLVLLTLCSARLCSAPVSDLVSADKRRADVDRSMRLSAPVEPEALPAELPQPFAPPGFEQPDPEEVRAKAVAKASATASSAASNAANAAPKPATDRDMLAHIAARIQPSGTFRVGTTTFLTFGQKRVRPGDILTVSYDGGDYDLELVSVDQSTFTLRLNKEEYTRPLKPAKNP